MGCHMHFEGNPHEFVQWARERLGDNYDVLIEKSNNLMLGKSNRHEKSAIASHYRQQYDEMLRKRAGGVIGYLEFMGW